MVEKHRDLKIRMQGSDIKNLQDALAAIGFVIGDKASDMELGLRIGATTLLVRTGYGAQVATQAGVNPDFVVNDLLEAATVIQRCVKEEQSERTQSRKF